MTLAKVGMVCFGTAFALHTFVMNVTLYGVGGGTKKESTDKACQAMMNIAFLSYGLAFMLSLVRGLGEDAGHVTSATRPIVVAALGLLGVVCYVVGMAVYGKYRGSEYVDVIIVSYHVCTYTMAAFFALVGSLSAIKDSGNGGYSREP